jgi:uncharacterized protein (TIGR02466 family)
MEDPFKVQHIFPTVIYTCLLQDPTIQQEMKLAVDQTSWNKVGGIDWGRTHKISTAHFDSDEVEKYNLLNFKRNMEIHLKKYLDELRMPFSDYRITSWFTRFDKGDFGMCHHHGDADISGCYYYKTNGRDGNLYFQSPNLAGDTSTYHSYHNTMFVHPPSVGKLVLFPGWLSHGITLNETEQERISFSFNIFFNRK